MNLSIMAKEVKIGHFCLSSPKESNIYSRVYLAEPEKRFLEKFGRLSILVNLSFKDNTKKQTFLQAKKWIQELIDFVKNDFYNPLKPGVDLEKELEDSLQKANSWIQQEKTRQADLFGEYLIDFEIDIILIKDNNVHFSQIGNIKTYLIKDNELTDLVEVRNKSTKFLNIISGKLEDNSVLFFATKNIFDYFSPEKIIQMLKQLPIQRIEAEIKQLLSDEVNRASLLALIISNRGQAPPPAKAKAKPVKKEAPPKPEIKKAAPDKTKKIIKKPAKRKKLKKIKPAPPDLPIVKTTRLTYLRKSLLIILIILAFLFAQSLIILSRQQIKARQARQYAQTVEELRIKQDDLSAALIYQDSIKIKKLSNEIKGLLNQLPQKTRGQEETYQFFESKYIQQMNKFYHLITVADPVLLIDLAETDKDIKANGLTNLGNNFYIFSSDNNYIYLFNLETKKLELVNKTSANVGRLKQLFPLDNDSLIGHDQNQGIASFNTIDKNLLPLKLNRTKPPQEIKDLYIYSRRLYTLEPLADQIYKHSKTIDGFSQEQAWIQDETSVSNALCFTIDGYIYVFKKTGQIFKFYQGKKIEFELDDIQPTLSPQDPNILEPKGEIKIYTNGDLRYLYLLDGPTKRLIILSKQGKLVKQFISNQFEDLKDFIISKKEDKAWLLAGTKIFEIEIK